MIALSIDGKLLQVQPGTTVLEAALANGIDIPRLCYHPDLVPSGGCRLCMVEIEGRPNPTASCGLACQEGMIIRTQSEQLTHMRRDIIDLFISDHPLDCVVCDKNGACDLQRYAYEFGVSKSSFEGELSRELCQDDNPFFVRDHKYCILCGKCARVCDEIIGRNVYDYAGRGFSSHIATPFDIGMGDTPCVFCGSCVQLCPTAALMPKSRLRQGREWDFTRKRTVCGYCGVGCQLEYAVKNGGGRAPHIVYARGFREAPVNGEFLCVKGRFGWNFASSPDRLTKPLIRRDFAAALGVSGEPSTLKGGENFVEVPWEIALDTVASRLAGSIKANGADSVAGLASARCTNEDNYLFQKLFRVGVGTNNVDHCARLCHASTVVGLGMAFGSGAMTNPIRDVRDADCILITGSNTAETHPVISYEVIRAVKKGATLIIIDPRRVPLADHATVFLQPVSGTDQHVFMAMMHVILREGWADKDFIAARTEGFEGFSRSLEEYTPEAAALASGVPAELIVKAAQAYALGERFTGRSKYEDERGHSSILYAMGITQRSNGTEMVLTLANLSMLCGQIGKPSTGVNPLRGQSNVQGACDVGCLPNVLPGYQPVTDEAKRKAVAQLWGLPDLPANPGLTVVEMMHAVLADRIQAMYIMGENPMLSDPNLNHVEEALKALDFLAVQDIFLSETAQLAHVVLPAASSLEKLGTITNTERRVQLNEPVIPSPGDARPDWVIVAEIGKRLDRELGNGHIAGYWEYPNVAAVADELAASAPIYRGIRHGRLVREGLTWPCPAEDHPGTPILHTRTFSRGLGKFHALKAQAPAEKPDAEYPLILNTGRVLYHYHTATMTRRSDALNWREPGGFVEINPQDASTAGVTEGSEVTIVSRRGTIQAAARISDRVLPGTIFLAFHWSEAPANVLTQDHTLDPVAKIPEYKVCAVRLESANGKNGHNGHNV